MFKYEREYSMEVVGLNEYKTIYENEWYEAFFVTKSEDGKPVRPQDPTVHDQLRIQMIRKNDRDPIISVWVKKEGSDRREFAKYGKAFGGSGEMMHKDNNKKWEKARKTILELNDLVEQLYPGYYITKEKE